MIYNPLNFRSSNSVEARRTVLDAYLYHENEHNDTETAISYDYGKSNSFLLCRSFVSLLFKNSSMLPCLGCLSRVI